MTGDLFALLLWTQLTLTVGLLTVLVLRLPVRRWFGARIAYGLWGVVPVAGLAWLLPGRRVEVEWFAVAPVAHQAAVTSASVPSAPSTPTVAMIILLFWVAGAVLSLALFALRQRRFVRTLGSLRPAPEFGAAVFMTRSTAGPVVIGVLKPRIVLPADFPGRFTAGERALVLAHERTHLLHRDPLVNAIVLMARSLCWFNPLVHAAADALRIDQELACDARVLVGARTQRRSYADAMLKAHHAGPTAPLSCAWPDRGFHPLKVRLAMLKREAPSAGRRSLGLTAAAFAALLSGAGVWGLRPVAVVAAPVVSGPVIMPGPATVPAAPQPSITAARAPISLAGTPAGTPEASAPPLPRPALALEQSVVRVAAAPAEVPPAMVSDGRRPRERLPVPRPGGPPDLKGVGGFWTTPEYDAVVVPTESGGTREFVAVVDRPRSPGWAAGDVAARFVQTDGTLEATLYQAGEGAPVQAPAALQRDGLSLRMPSLTWGRRLVPPDPGRPRSRGLLGFTTPG